MSAADKSAREHALEEKKKKLEELRQMRAQRMQQASIDETGSARMAALALSNQGGANNAAPGHKPTQSAEDILNSVSSLIAAPAAASKTTAPATQAAAAPQSSGGHGSARSSPKLGASAPTHIDIVGGDSKIVYEQSTQTELKRKQAEAEAAAAVAGSPTATATAGTSMAAVWDSIDSDERDEIIHERDDLRTREVTLLSRIRELTRANQTRAAEEEAAAEKALHAELDPAEAEKILESEEFGSFLDRSSKIMERLLGFEASARGAKGAAGGGGAGLLASSLDGFDYMQDYSAADENEFDGKNGRGVGEQMLTPSIVFSNEGAPGSGASAAHGHSGGGGLSFARTTNRPVTSINWSPKFPELLLASYACSQTSMDATDNASTIERENWMEPDGSVLVWNLHMQKRPEFMFSCQSSIHTALFHPAHPKLIVGGCENGQLVIWDIRVANRHTPVNRSSLSSGHTHPIFALDIQPLASGLFQIVSASSDGQVCLWTENNLHRPLHDIQLTNMRGNTAGAGASASADSSSGGGINLGSKDELTTTCFDLPGRDTNTLILGSDEGRIYKARLHDATAAGSGSASGAAANSAAGSVGGGGLSSGGLHGDRIYEQIQAHEAPMTALQFHPTFKSSTAGGSAAGQPTNDLFLTASFDWTVKLWSNKLSRPLYTFESSRDYVHAAAWCPTNPYVFASGDGTGHLDIWSLAGKGEGEDAGEVPTVSVQVGAGGGSGAQSAAGAGAEIVPPVSASPAPGADPSSAADSSSSLLRPNHAAISAIKWNDTGSLIAAGLSSGALHIYSVSSELHTPTREATDRFYNNIANRMAHPR